MSVRHKSSLAWGLGHSGPGQFTAVDLFAGCGGLSVGLQRAGFNVLAAIEKDPQAAATYALNHRDTSIWDDAIEDVECDEFMEFEEIAPFELDLLAGCPPCQGFSKVRTLNGSFRVIDNRNDLIFDFLRFIEALRPKTVMMENVPGLAQDNRFRRFQNHLTRLKYRMSWSIVDVAGFGVPQRRRRLVLFASVFDKPRLPIPNQRISTVRDAIGGLPLAGKSGDHLHDLPENRSLKIRRLIASIPRDGGSRSALGKRRQLRCHRDCDGFKDVYGRMAWDKVSPTITGGCFNPSKGRFLHPSANRAITMREAGLLQTFPRKYRFLENTGKEPIARMIGNALPPAFAISHAKAIRSHLDEHLIS